MEVRVLVTGGVGFVGSFITEKLFQKHPQWQITVFDLRAPKTPVKGVRYELGSVTDLKAVNAVVKRVKPRVIVHTAGMVPDLAKRYNRDEEYRVYNANVNGTKIMLQVAQENAVEAFVWTGSCTAVTDDMKREYHNIDEKVPTSTKSTVYGESKAAAETLVLAANSSEFATCALRPSVLFGEGDYQLVPSVHACIAKWETPFVIGDGFNLWDASYAGNVADAHVLAVENLLDSKTAAGEAIFIANEEPITFRDFSLAVWRNFDHYPPFTFYIPKAVAVAVGFLAECVTRLTGTSTTISRGSVLDASAIRYCDGLKARRLLGYKPSIGIEEGLKRSCLEYAQRLDAKSRNKPTRST